MTYRLRGSHAWICCLSSLAILIGSFQLLIAEEVVITIRLVEGRSGKAIKDENLNIFRNQLHFAENFHVDQNGMIRLRIDRDSLVSFASNIQVNCHRMTDDERSRHELQQYKVEDILEHGISDTNTCSKKIRVEAKPGEFVYYERPRTFWEWMSL